ncbi:nitroreductase family deazaflavin-dependent oxidoreductase [Mumia sp. DW29H23]|uniref:nitroreductase family deazaflavin-dependent oxidoreductase n=1 Tax=Mumia sp. DW29H23 TaxID=3421241 RepID=UPI003D68E858
MALPRRMRRMNRDGFNRLAVHVAPWLPGMGVVVHRGRRSGRAYRTPVMVFRHADRLVIALPYGTDTDWLRNVRAAAGASVVTRRRTLHVVDPHLVHDPERASVPAPVRLALAGLHVDDFLVTRVVDGPPTA